MKIAFLDFEFGQINGSHRRDFLVTQTAILMYDTDLDNLKLAEVIFKPNIELVMREKVKDENNNKFIIKEEVINYHTNRVYGYDKEFKIPKIKRKQLRQKWNCQFFSKLVKFLQNTLYCTDIICVFGGNEDKNILKRYNCNIENIVDIQTLLFNTYNIRYSLDKVINTLNINNFLYKNKIKSINYIYNLPKKSKTLYRYDKNNLIAHNASGDCVRLFLVYKELIYNLK